MSTRIPVEAELNAVNTRSLSTQSLSARLTWQLAIVSLLLIAFCLGFPQFHYTAALMVAAILRYKDTPGDIFAPLPVR